MKVKHRSGYEDKLLEQVVTALGPTLITIAVSYNDEWDAVLELVGRETFIGIDSVSCRAANGSFLIPHHSVRNGAIKDVAVEGATLAWCKEYDVFIGTKSTTQSGTPLSVFSATVRSAKKLGFGSEQFDSGATAVSFGPSFLYRYLTSIDAVHALAGSKRTLAQVSELAMWREEIACKPKAGIFSKSLWFFILRV